MLATILPSCKTISNFTNNKSIKRHSDTKYTIPFVSKESPKKKNQINILSRFPGLPKCHRQILKTKAYPSTHGPITTMFRASASNHRQHKHPSCRLCYRHALYQYAFALKAQSYELIMFLNILQRGPTPPQKLRINTNYTHCTYNFNAQVTDDFLGKPLPADQQLGR